MGVAYLLPAGLSVTAEQINPHGTGARKTETRVEDSFRHKKRNPLDVWDNSANKCACECLRRPCYPVVGTPEKDADLLGTGDTNQVLLFPHTSSQLFSVQRGRACGVGC